MTVPFVPVIRTRTTVSKSVSFRFLTVKDPYYFPIVNISFSKYVINSFSVTLCFFETKVILTFKTIYKI